MSGGTRGSWSGKSLVRRAFAIAGERGELPQCPYCGVTLRINCPSEIACRAVVDHKQPLARGGDRTAQENLLVCCNRCNNMKGPLTYEEFLMFKDDPMTLGRKRKEMQRIVTKRNADLLPVKEPVELAEPRRTNVARVKEELVLSTPPEHQRKLAGLRQRLHIPDVNCATCRGSGYLDRRHLYLCHCTVLTPCSRCGQTASIRRDSDGNEVCLCAVIEVPGVALEAV